MREKEKKGEGERERKREGGHIYANRRRTVGTETSLVNKHTPTTVKHTGEAK